MHMYIGYVIYAHVHMYIWERVINCGSGGSGQKIIFPAQQIPIWIKNSSCWLQGAFLGQFWFLSNSTRCSTLLHPKGNPFGPKSPAFGSDSFGQNLRK